MNSVADGRRCYRSRSVQYSGTSHQHLTVQVPPTATFGRWAKGATRRPNLRSTCQQLRVRYGAARSLNVLGSCALFDFSREKLRLTMRAKVSNQPLPGINLSASPHHHAGYIFGAECRWSPIRKGTSNPPPGLATGSTAAAHESRVALSSATFTEYGKGLRSQTRRLMAYTAAHMSEGRSRRGAEPGSGWHFGRRLCGLTPVTRLCTRKVLYLHGVVGIL